MKFLYIMINFASSAFVLYFMFMCVMVIFNMLKYHTIANLGYAPAYIVEKGLKKAEYKTLLKLGIFATLSVLMFFIYVMFFVPHTFYP